MWFHAKYATSVPLTFFGAPARFVLVYGCEAPASCPHRPPFDFPMQVTGPSDSGVVSQDFPAFGRTRRQATVDV